MGKGANSGAVLGVLGVFVVWADPDCVELEGKNSGAVLGLLQVFVG